MISTKCTLELSPRRQTELLAFAYDASRIDGHCIGWFPRTAYVEAHTRGNIIACYNNSDLVGFLVYNHHLAATRIYQIWVRRDARMLVHGRSLVDHLNAIAAHTGTQLIGLWCAEDLEANLFWPAIGFAYKNWRWGKAKNPRRHRHWIRPVTDPRLLVATSVDRS